MISTHSYIDPLLTQYQPQLKALIKKILFGIVLALIATGIHSQQLTFGETADAVCKRDFSNSTIHSPVLLQKGAWMSDVALAAHFTKDQTVTRFMRFYCR